MRTSVRVNKSLMAIVLAAGVLMAPALTNAAAAYPPCCGVDTTWTYYSTAAKTTIVGQGFDSGDCGPEKQNWGYATPYYTTTRVYCET